MQKPRALLRAGTLALLIVGGMSCDDVGLIGTEDVLPCEPACAPGLACDPTLGMCVADCSDSGCVDASAPACDGGVCVACRAPSDCQDGGVCIAGRCAECSDDSDCDGEGSRMCRDGRCADEEEEDEEAEQDDSSGDDG